MATIASMPGITSLSQTLHSSPADLLAPPTALSTTALAELSTLLGPLAAEIQALHSDRTTEARALKRKRGTDAGADQDSLAVEKRLREWDERRSLRLGNVHTKGFGVEQVWEQVRRVVGAVVDEVKGDLEESGLLGEGGDLEGSEAESSEADEDALEFEEMDSEEDEEVDDDGEDLEDGLGEEDLDESSEDEELGGLDEGESHIDEDDEEEETGEYVQDPNGLNDGFFSIDDFNKRTDFLEAADARGGDDGAASDEEEVDWDADPLAAGTGLSGAKANSKATKKDDDDDDDDDEGDGPTFGNMDLDAPEGASDDEDELEGGEMDDMDDVNNANNILYKDFFAPPAKKASKNKKGRPHPHNFPARAAAKATEDPEADYNDGALSRVHRDLFSDDEDAAEDLDDEDDEGQEVPPSQRNLSTHEKRRLALSKEIATLESTLVSKKPWALSGEASSSSRPLNSLLEEDLAFERTGKPVPVITAEVSADLETLIKSRILAKDFQDIYRRRPDDLATTRGPRERPELSDSKNKKSLAELYEDDHLIQTTGAGKDAAELSEKERKEQAEIINLWAEVRGQLDSLSNFSLRPKAPTVSLEIRTDTAVAKMEDARPTMGADAAGTSALAPSEVYRTGSAVDKESGEVLVGGRKGLVVSKDEVERGAGKRARRRAKDRARKKGENEGTTQVLGKKAREEKGVLGQLKKGGVKVIGKSGEVTDVEGNKVKGQNAAGAGSYKL